MAEMLARYADITWLHVVTFSGKQNSCRRLHFIRCNCFGSFSFRTKRPWPSRHCEQYGVLQLHHNVCSTHRAIIRILLMKAMME
jgi:hypothetical protein